MLSNHRLQVALEEIKEISRMDFALYNDKAKMLAGTTEFGDMEELLEAFIGSEEESGEIRHYLFFKVVVEEQLAYVLLGKSQGDESKMVGRLAVCQLRNMVLSDRSQLDKNSFMQNVLFGNMFTSDIYQKAKRVHIDQARRLVFVIETVGDGDGTVIEYVRNMFASPQDFVTEIEKNNIVLIKDIRHSEEPEEWEQLAGAITDNLHSEAMVRVRVAYGNPAQQIEDIPRSYGEGKTALKVGKIFYIEQDVYAYSKLGIGRLIYQLPRNLCEMFLKEVFGEHIPEEVYDEETGSTIQKLFENNLNISEAARQLFVHRNTLVYRLERIQKSIGLDVRVFEDALLFRIALLVLAYLKTENTPAI